MRKYLLLALVLVSTSVSAQELSLSQKLEIRSNCKADFERLCPGIAPGGGKLIECIRANKDQLSKPCAETIGKVMASKQN